MNESERLIRDLESAEENIIDLSIRDLKLLLVRSRLALVRRNGLTKGMLEELQQVAIEWGENSIGESEQDVKDTYLSDQEDILKLHSLLSKGKHKKAKKHLRSLDTIIRDQIPDRLWYWMMNNIED